MPRPKRPRPEPSVLLKAARLYATHEKYGDIAKAVNKKPRDARWIMEQSMEWLLEQQGRLARMERVETVQDRLEEKVITRFPHLRKVQIVAAGKIRSAAQYAALVRQWGVIAADYLDRLAEDAERLDAPLHVGLSGGETILEIVTNLLDRNRPDVHFHALALIGRGQLLESFHVGPETNTTIAWSRSGRFRGTCHYGTVSPHDTALKSLSPDERREQVAADLKEFAGNASIKRVICGMENLDIAFGGLGLADPRVTNANYAGRDVDRLTMTGLLKPIGIDPNELTSEGAIGDLGCCLFNDEGGDQPKDARGKTLSEERWRFFLTAGHYSQHPGLKFYRNMVDEKRAVVVIAGVNKEPAIRAALRGKLFNHWITDDLTVRSILDSD